MTDDDFLQQFEARTLPFDQWHHRAHVRLAYLYAVRFGPAVAAQKLRDGIRAYNAVNHVPDSPTSGYHETMTLAWLHLIHTTLQLYGPRATAEDHVMRGGKPELNDQLEWILPWLGHWFNSEQWSILNSHLPL